jgi:hypothetical protein
MDVFIPAMLAALVAAIAITLPIIFSSMLAGTAARIPILAVCGVVGLAGIVGAVVLALPEAATLAAQVPALQRQIDDRYGVQITSDEAGRLLDGNKLKIPETGVKSELSLRPAGGGRYILTTGGLAGELPTAT